MTLVFIATSAQAREKEYKHKWYNPFAGIWSAIGNLNNDTKSVDRKVKHLDRKIKHIDQKIREMKAKGNVGPRGPRGERGEPGSVGPEGPPGKMVRFICPGCDFSYTEEWSDQAVEMPAVFSGQSDLEDINNELFAGAYLANAYFEHGNFSEVNFSNAVLHHCKFSNSKLINANFSYANLKNANFGGADLTKANFTGANIKGVVWWEKWMTNYYSPTVCPDGAVVTDVGDTCINNLQ
jgi:hypothetical protein